MRNFGNGFLLSVLTLGPLVGCSSSQPDANAKNAHPIAATTTPTTTTTDPGPTADPYSSDFHGTPSPMFVDILTERKIVYDLDDQLQARLLADYGAMFVTSAVPPPGVIFDDEASVEAWQGHVPSQTELIGSIGVTLQSPAMDALKEARDEARKLKLDITPRGSDGSTRGYDDTVKLWRSRVEPALDHWVKAGKLAVSEADRIRRLSPREQIPEVLKLEGRGIWFSTGFDKSILYSVAAPGTSQHISMLALDVKEFENATVRQILARHGWYQTIRTDLPHFTFIGEPEDKLPALGLKKVTANGRVFWIPDFK